jgi:hypothetical protein
MRTYREHTQKTKNTPLLLPPHATVVEDYLCGCITRLKAPKKKKKGGLLGTSSYITQESLG